MPEWYRQPSASNEHQDTAWLSWCLSSTISATIVPLCLNPFCEFLSSGSSAGPFLFMIRRLYSFMTVERLIPQYFMRSPFLWTVTMTSVFHYSVIPPSSYAWFINPSTIAIKASIVEQLECDAIFTTCHTASCLI